MRKKDPTCSNTNSYSIRKKLRKIDFQFWRYFLKMVGFGLVGMMTISVLGQDRVSPQITYVATAADFAKMQEASTDNNKESAEVVYGPGDYEFLPNPLPYNELTAENSDALQMKRDMTIAIFVTPEALAHAESTGVNIIDQVRKTTNGFEEVIKNCGGNLKCNILPEIKVVPNSVFQDVIGNTGSDVAAFINTGLTEGTWMDDELDDMTSANNVPRLAYPYMVVSNLPSAAYTNFGGPGMPIEAGTLFNPLSGIDEQLSMILGHEVFKQINIENANFPWEQLVPVDENGELVYDLRPDGGNIPIRALVSLTHTGMIYVDENGEISEEGEKLPMSSLRYLKKTHSGPDGKVQLFDRTSQSMVEFDYGDEERDAWHTAPWKDALDKFTFERTGDLEAPQFDTTSFSHTGMLDGIEDISLSFSLTKVVTRGAGSIQIIQEDGTIFHDFTDEEITIDETGKVTFAALDFPPETKMTVEFDEGAFEDASDNLSPADESWHFETPADTTAPSIVAGSFYPSGTLENFTENQEIALSFACDEPVKQGSGTMEILKNGVPYSGFSFMDANIDATGKIVSFPKIAFESEGIYTITIPAGYLTDLSGNPLPARTYTFETPDITGPVPLAEGGLSPEGEITGTTIPLVMKFNEAIQKGAGFITVYNKATGAVLQTHPVGDLTVAGNEASLLIEKLPEETTVSVEMDAGGVIDVKGNESKKIENWDITTGVSLVGTGDLEALKIGFSVYPVPTARLLNIELNVQNATTAGIIITDEHGRSAKHVADGVNLQPGQKKAIQCDLGNLASGIYFVKILLKNGDTLSRKIIVQ